MPPDTDWTDVLPPVDDSPPPRQRRPADAWFRINLYGTHLAWSLAVVLVIWVLLVGFHAAWKAR